MEEQLSSGNVTSSGITENQTEVKKTKKQQKKKQNQKNARPHSKVQAFLKTILKNKKEFLYF